MLRTLLIAAALFFTTYARKAFTVPLAVGPKVPLELNVSYSLPAEFNKKPYRYSFGDIPITRLKNFPKNVCDGNPNCWLICKIVRLVPFSKARASLTT